MVKLKKFTFFILGYLIMKKIADLSSYLIIANSNLISTDWQKINNFGGKRQNETYGSLLVATIGAKQFLRIWC